MGCGVETTYQCEGNEPDTCTTSCGNGKREENKAEMCDDGNQVDGDGCSSTCQAMQGFLCQGGTSSTADTCTVICGDGLRKGDETCDDGNALAGDGCDDSCNVEDGWACETQPAGEPDECAKPTPAPVPVPAPTPVPTDDAAPVATDDAAPVATDDAAADDAAP